MRQKSVRLKEPAEKVVKDIRRATRKRHSSEEKIRIVLEGLRGEDSIARALYKQPRVIVFDEATSALDNQTEAAVMRSISGLREDLMVFIIAHRLSTVGGYDQVANIANGRIDWIGAYGEVNRSAMAEDSSRAR